MSDLNTIAQPGQPDHDNVTSHAASHAARRANDDTARRATRSPRVDIVEDLQAVTLFADLPGVPRDRLDIKVHDGSLTIEAESVVATPANLRPVHAEVRAPHFARRFTVSDDFDTSRIDASLKDGVLKLTIPRRERSKPRRIDVNVG